MSNAAEIVKKYRKFNKYYVYNFILNINVYLIIFNNENRKEECIKERNISQRNEEMKLLLNPIRKNIFRSEKIMILISIWKL